MRQTTTTTNGGPLKTRVCYGSVLSSGFDVKVPRSSTQMEKSHKCGETKCTFYAISSCARVFVQHLFVLMVSGLFSGKSCWNAFNDYTQLSKWEMAYNLLAFDSISRFNLCTMRPHGHCVQFHLTCWIFDPNGFRQISLRIGERLSRRALQSARFYGRSGETA